MPFLPRLSSNPGPVGASGWRALERTNHTITSSNAVAPRYVTCLFDHVLATVHSEQQLENSCPVHLSMRFETTISTMAMDVPGRRRLCLIHAVRRFLISAYRAVNVSSYCRPFNRFFPALVYCSSYARFQHRLYQFGCKSTVPHQKKVTVMTACVACQSLLAR